MRLEGGSFDVTQVKLTEDLYCDGLGDNSSCVAIQASCTPSQRLKEKNKEKFYYRRLVLEVDEGGKFQKFVLFPYCHCNCPNGLIIYGHLGALMLLIHSISCLLVDAR